jgi:hypothetical protein
MPSASVAMDELFVPLRFSLFRQQWHLSACGPCPVTFVGALGH